MIRLRLTVAAAVFLAVATFATPPPLIATDRGDEGQRSTGWQLPPDAPDKKNPLTVNDQVLADGRKIFADKCRKCHGPQGLGDGPDADPERIEEMNLTNPKRAERNPDGVVFYKVSNGRAKPKMPVFKDELNESQIWSVVAYVQSLRKK
jgi:mono/diheme cytochrome c family protein